MLKDGARDLAPGQRFNRACAAAVLNGAPYNYLAAPAIGSAIVAHDVDLILLALREAGVEREQLGAKLLEALAKLGRKLLRDGKPVDGEESERLANDFVNSVFVSKFPSWQKLGVVR
jgi:hypothetical protein